MSLLSAGVGGSGAGAPTGALPDGTYYQFGLVSNKPEYGEGWLPFTVAVTSSGASITILEVRSSRSIAQWTLGADYKGTNTDNYWRRNGVAWTSMTNTEGFGFLPHVSYSSDVRAGTFSGEPATTVWLCQMTESDTSGGNIKLNSSAVV